MVSITGRQTDMKMNLPSHDLVTPSSGAVALQTHGLRELIAYGEGRVLLTPG